MDCSTSKTDIASLEFEAELRNLKCLNICELQLILGDQMRLNPRRSAESQMLIRSSHEYASRFARLKSRNAILEVRSNLEREGDLHEFEIALIVNLLPKTTDEARVLIPSLTRISEGRLNRILEQLESYRAYSC